MMHRQLGHKAFPNNRREESHASCDPNERSSSHCGKVVSAAPHTTVMGIAMAHRGDHCVCRVKGHEVCFIAKGELIAEKEITFVVTGGAYLTLKGGNVEIGGPGAMTINTDGHHWNGPASGKTALPTFSEGEFARIPRLLRATDGQPVEGMQVHVARAG
ncbi:DUF2345 domain-containing protein, partial [Massilia sp. S19_KUP03_FR1]|uniref:DUF2345 domain-containing protein n=1 Tax=Massilia sp. S19_KUP03_FR1 TaxID=3025503 RepID=UPI002FCD76B1